MKLHSYVPSLSSSFLFSLSDENAWSELSINDPEDLPNETLEDSFKCLNTNKAAELQYNQEEGLSTLLQTTPHLVCPKTMASSHLLKQLFYPSSSVTRKMFDLPDSNTMECCNTQKQCNKHDQSENMFFKHSLSEFLLEGEEEDDEQQPHEIKRKGLLDRKRIMKDCKSLPNLHQPTSLSLEHNNINDDTSSTKTNFFFFEDFASNWDENDYCQEDDYLQQGFQCDSIPTSSSFWDHCEHSNCLKINEDFYYNSVALPSPSSSLSFSKPSFNHLSNSFVIHENPKLQLCSFKSEQDHHLNNNASSNKRKRFRSASGRLEYYNNNKDIMGLHYNLIDKSKRKTRIFSETVNGANNEYFNNDINVKIKICEPDNSNNIATQYIHDSSPISSSLASAAALSSKTVIPSLLCKQKYNTSKRLSFLVPEPKRSARSFSHSSTTPDNDNFISLSSSSSTFLETEEEEEDASYSKKTFVSFVDYHKNKSRDDLEQLQRCVRHMLNKTKKKPKRREIFLSFDKTTFLKNNKVSSSLGKCKSLGCNNRSEDFNYSDTDDSDFDDSHNKLTMITDSFENEDYYLYDQSEDTSFFKSLFEFDEDDDNFFFQVEETFKHATPINTSNDVEKQDEKNEAILLSNNNNNDIIEKPNDSSLIKTANQKENLPSTNLMSKLWIFWNNNNNNDNNLTNGNNHKTPIIPVESNFDDEYHNSSTNDIGINSSRSTPDLSRSSFCKKIKNNDDEIKNMEEEYGSVSAQVSSSSDSSNEPRRHYNNKDDDDDRAISVDNHNRTEMSIFHNDVTTEESITATFKETNNITQPTIIHPYLNHRKNNKILSNYEKNQNDEEEEEEEDEIIPLNNNDRLHLYLEDVNLDSPRNSSDHSFNKESDNVTNNNNNNNWSKTILSKYHYLYDDSLISPAVLLGRESNSSLSSFMKQIIETTATTFASMSSAADDYYSSTFLVENSIPHGITHGQVMSSTKINKTSPAEKFCKWLRTNVAWQNHATTDDLKCIKHHQSTIKEQNNYYVYDNDGINELPTEVKSNNNVLALDINENQNENFIVESTHHDDDSSSKDDSNLQQKSISIVINTEDEECLINPTTTVTEDFSNASNNSKIKKSNNHSSSNGINLFKFGKPRKKVLA